MNIVETRASVTPSGRLLETLSAAVKNAAVYDHLQTLHTAGHASAAALLAVGTLFLFRRRR